MWNAEHMRYLCYQVEKTPTTGVLHYQGYVEWLRPRQGNHAEAKLLFAEPYAIAINKKGVPQKSLNCKFFAAKGTAAENRAYCSKVHTRVDDSFCEYGEPATQGKRMDVKVCMDMLAKTGDVKEVALAHPEVFVKFHRGFDRFAELMEKKRPADCRPEVLILWSPKSGTGKSRKARAIIEEQKLKHYSVQRTRGDTTWWAGYNGEECALFDEYVPGDINPTQMLRMIDYGECRVKVYGSERQLLAHKFIFTSNFDPETWLGTGEDNKTADAWRRRLAEFATIIKME